MIQLTDKQLEEFCRAVHKHPWDAFHGEHVRIRGAGYKVRTRSPHYLGHMPATAIRFAKSPKEQTS